MNFVTNFFVFTFIICVIVKETYCYALTRPNAVDPEYPDLCFYDGFGEREASTFYLKPEQRRRHPKKCVDIKCNEDLSLTIIGCGPGAVAQNCHYIRDMNKPFPHCCGEAVC